MTPPDLHPMAPDHLPGYLAAADGSDSLFTTMVVLTLAAILGLGILYFTLHALPERMAHGSNHMQLQLISILVLLALFTHNNAFWIMGILIAAFRVPDFLSPLRSIARSLNRLARQTPAPKPASETQEQEAENA